MRAQITRVSNPFHSLSFRASALVKIQIIAFALGIPPNVYIFHHSNRETTSTQGLARLCNKENRPGEALGYLDKALALPGMAGEKLAEALCLKADVEFSMV